MYKKRYSYLDIRISAPIETAIRELMYFKSYISVLSAIASASTAAGTSDVVQAAHNGYGEGGYGKGSYG